MAYEKQNFKPGDILRAEQLNLMEKAIFESVSINEQELTEEQKAQARLNIGITGTGSDANVTKENVESALGYAPAMTPIISTTDITAGSAAPDGRSYHVIE